MPEKKAESARRETPKGYSRVVGPDQKETLVPDEIKQALLDSGYSEAK